MGTKSILKSKTFWFNVLLGLLGVTTLITGDDLKVLGLGENAEAKVLIALGAFNTVGNIILRSATSAQVTIPTLKKKQ